MLVCSYGEQPTKAVARLAERKIARITHRKLMDPKQRGSPLFATTSGIYKARLNKPGFRGCTCSRPCTPRLRSTACSATKDRNKHTKYLESLRLRGHGGKMLSIRGRGHRVDYKAPLPAAPAAPTVTGQLPPPMHGPAPAPSSLTVPAPAPSTAAPAPSTAAPSTAAPSTATPAAAAVHNGAQWRAAPTPLRDRRSARPLPVQVQSATTGLWAAVLDQPGEGDETEPFRGLSGSLRTTYDAAAVSAAPAVGTVGASHAGGLDAAAAAAGDSAVQAAVERRMISLHCRWDEHAASLIGTDETLRQIPTLLVLLNEMGLPRVSARVRLAPPTLPHSTHPHMSLHSTEPTLGPLTVRAGCEWGRHLREPDRLQRRRKRYAGGARGL